MDGDIDVVPGRESHKIDLSGRQFALRNLRPMFCPARLDAARVVLSPSWFKSNFR